MTTTIPDQIHGHWNTDDGSGMAKHYAPMTRANLTHGTHTDMRVAFRIVMLQRNDREFEPTLAAARDRIRWLSVQLAMATHLLEIFSASMEPAPMDCFSEAEILLTKLRGER